MKLHDTRADAGKASLAFRCVDLLANSDVEELQAMVDRSCSISFETFSRHVDWMPTARLMGYATENAEPGMRLDGDRAVSFHSSSWRGEPVYYMVHSAIEFVFRRQPPHKAIRPASAWGGMETVDTSPREPQLPSGAPRARRARP